MSWLWDMAYAAAAMLSSPLWGWRLWRTGKWRTDWRGRFGAADAPTDGRTTLLIHAVSVGEVNAIRRLVERLVETGEGELRIVISSTTDTGTARAKSLFEPRHRVVRYPLDFSPAVRRFLDAVKPDAVALAELEVWPNFVAACERRGVPVIVLNGRLSARSFRRYRKIRPLVARTFARLAAVAAQSEAYAKRFIALGARRERVEVVGTMKWDSAVIRDDVPGADELAKAMGIDRRLPLIVCGSTGPGEERLLVDRLADLTAPGAVEGTRPVQLLIAPRKPERFDQAAAAMGDPVRRTSCPDGSVRPPGENRLFLLDTIGELAKGYTLADVAVVGRSFCPLYGSDMIEPISLGAPTVIGPNVADFRTIMSDLLAGEGIVQVSAKRADELREAVGRLMDPEAGRALARRGRAVIRRRRGATERHVDKIHQLLATRSSER